VHRVDDTSYVDSPWGSTTLLELPRFPLPEDAAASGSLVAPLPGIVDDVCVSVGQLIEVGQLLVVIESMKMLHRVTAPHAGHIREIRVERKSQVQAGAVLVVIADA
jgi:propionyl-CoA carboxylase alpha chain